MKVLADTGPIVAAANRRDHVHNLAAAPILTFDFEDFRAAPPKDGYWRLVVDEERYQKAVR